MGVESDVRIRSIGSYRSELRGDGSTWISSGKLK